MLGISRHACWDLLWSAGVFLCDAVWLEGLRGYTSRSSSEVVLAPASLAPCSCRGQFLTFFGCLMMIADTKKKKVSSLRQESGKELQGRARSCKDRNMMEYDRLRLNIEQPIWQALNASQSTWLESQWQDNSRRIKRLGCLRWLGLTWVWHGLTNDPTSKPAWMWHEDTLHCLKSRRSQPGCSWRESSFKNQTLPHLHHTRLSPHALVHEVFLKPAFSAEQRHKKTEWCLERGFNVPRSGPSIAQVSPWKSVTSLTVPALYRTCP